MRTGTARRPRLLVKSALATAVALSAAAPANAAPIAEHIPSAEDRYTLAEGCFALRSEQAGAYVVKAGGAYSATADAVGSAEPFRMRATALGRYLFYGPARDFMARNGSSDAVTAANTPSDDSDWTVTEDGGAFRISVAGRDLAVGGGDALVTVAGGSGGAAGLFDFEPAAGCADYPEVEVNVSGPLPAAQAPDAKVTGLVETHMHGMAFHFLGTKAHCGRPWHRFGAPHALVDCPDHEPNGCAAVLENTVSHGTPVGPCHDTDGWPTFTGWPTHDSLTHEQSYYRWIERSWRAGLRIWVNLMVENRVLCEIYPLTPQPSVRNCNEMDSVRKQVEYIHQLEDYIDAQWGGPGKGWYRIVESADEARAVINDGKLAVVKGMEVSEPFNCRLMQVPGPDTPMCSESMVDDGIDELYGDLGIRQVELVNKFDNALSGIAGDPGPTGTLTNLGNFYSAGTFWDLEHCDDEQNSDHTPAPSEDLHHNDDQIIANGLDAFGDQTGITFPVYGPPPHCNQRGLLPLGERAIRRLMSKGMIFDPDHMSVLARNQALDLIEDEQYPGVMTSHSWSTENALPRISALGGLIGPAAKSPQGLVADWNHIREHGYDDLNPHTFGFGYGADMNGFASQGGPPPEAGRIEGYPFQSPIDPTQMVDQQVSGEKTYDYNATGTAHYGMYADWTKSVHLLGGDAIIEDMKNGAEAYLQMWERAEAAANPGGGGDPGGGGGSGGGDSGSGGPPQGAGPPAGKAKDPGCGKLRKKLKRQKGKLKRGQLGAKKRKRLVKNKRKTRERLRGLDC